MGISDIDTVTSPPKGDESRAVSQSAPVEGIGVGTRIRQYELLRELGRGGMGQVYLARDTRLARRVALKFLKNVQGLTEAVLAEARATARCTHENIVVIHEVDEHEGTPYMVLEYLEGITLKALRATTKISWGRAVELVLPIVRALVQAHEFGIVHRDLKPENVFVMRSGSVKVLDFGIATLQGDASPQPTAGEIPFVGTLPYMAPEQIGIDKVDQRIDLWAVGIMLFELIAGKHPLAPVTFATLVATLSDLDRPMPSLGSVATDAPEALVRVVDRCLSKRKAQRFESARELCDELEKLLPGRGDRRGTADACPYPGLAAFQESDADRFFGRDGDSTRVAARLRDQPLVGIIGPSGIGKSSLVRAGVLPALRANGDVWSVLAIRPGRSPLASLATLMGEGEPDLITSPGALGAALRARAARDGGRLLVFVDQFEELYTLCADETQRRVFTRCLAGVADDANGPLRVLITMRSDFLDRAGEDARFLEDLTRGLVFVQPLGKEGVREALVRPLEPLGYTFESAAIVDEMVGALAAASGALPLLQFAASRLWDARDRDRKLLTHARHHEMGGIAGALASYADEVLATLPPASQPLIRSVLQRLVTPERTRAIVGRQELRGLAHDAQSIDAIIDQLVQARLLVVQQGTETTVELVHESLIRSWPTLARWLDEDHEDAAYIAHLRTAATQWEQKGRAPGLLWRGEAEREARQFRERYRGALGAREQAFLEAVLQLGGRSARIRRVALIAAIAVLSLIAVGSAIALVAIRHAQQDAQDQAERAQDEAKKAQQETDRAHNAEGQVQAQLDQLKAEQAARATAEAEARTKGNEAEMSREQLQVALEKAEQEKKVAEQESQHAHDAEARAEAATQAERELRQKAEAQAEKERQHATELEERSKQITTSLKK